MILKHTHVSKFNTEKNNMVKIIKYNEYTENLIFIQLHQLNSVQYHMARIIKYLEEI
jgi:hypothetical protein